MNTVQIFRIMTEELKVALLSVLLLRNYWWNIYCILNQVEHKQVDFWVLMLQAQSPEWGGTCCVWSTHLTRASHPQMLEILFQHAEICAFLCYEWPPSPNCEKVGNCYHTLGLQVGKTPLVLQAGRCLVHFIWGKKVTKCTCLLALSSVDITHIFIHSVNSKPLWGGQQWARAGHKAGQSLAVPAVCYNDRSHEESY